MALGMACAALVSAEDCLQMKVERVSLFKNGYSRVLLKGTLPDAAEVQVKNMPVPIFGTLDWRTPDGISIQQLVSSRSEKEIPQHNITWYDQALANHGREVKIATVRGEEFRGTIISPEPKQQAKPETFISSNEPEAAMVKQSIIVLRTPQGAIQSIHASNVRYISIIGGAPGIPTDKVTATDLRMQLSEAAPGQPMEMECLAWGLSWLPEYRLELADNGTARMIGRVVVLNHLMDLKDVQLELVSGYPALGNALVSSPLVRLSNVDQYLHAIWTNIDWLSQISPPQHDTYRAKALAQVHSAWETSYDNTSDGVSFGEGGSASLQEGQQLEDLYYYPIPKFSCKMGEVVEQDLFTQNISYEHVYTCAVPDQQRLKEEARSGAATMADIWHSLRLTNEGDIPWSTGIVTCYMGERLVSRGMLKYIPAGRKGLLPLNKTLEATVQCSEEWVNKDSSHSSLKIKSSISSDSDTYRQIFRGELKLSNKSDHEMAMEVTKSILGTPTEASDEGQIHISPVYDGNPISSVMWKIRLAPGETKVLIYTYEFEID